MTVPAGAAAYPLLTGAQQKAKPLIGYFNGTTPDANAALLGEFRQGLGEAGYVEGQNLAIEYRWAEFHYDRLPALAAELVERKVALIAACGGAGEALAAQGATSTIPIVFTVGADPVKTGLVASLQRPGGNLMGAYILNLELAQKRVGLIAELAPQARVIGYLMNPNNSAIEPNIASARQARVSRAGAPLRKRRQRAPASPSSSQGRHSRAAGSTRRLQRLGWIEGRNLVVERRVTGEDPERRKTAAAELIATTRTSSSLAAWSVSPGKVSQL